MSKDRVLRRQTDPERARVVPCGVPVSDDRLDAPDGAVIEMEDGWWERRGPRWWPIFPPEDEEGA